MSEYDDITSLRPIHWRTTLSKKVDAFRDVIQDDVVFDKYFGERYIKNLTRKSRSFAGWILKLSIIYTLLTLSLFASQVVGNKDVQFLWYGFKNISNYKELLLLVASLLSPTVAILQAYKRYLDALVVECIKKLSPDDAVREFYSYMYIDEALASLVYIKCSNSDLI